MNDNGGLERGPKRFRLRELTSAQQFWIPLAIVLVLALAGGGIATVATSQDAPLPLAGEEDDDGGVVAPAPEEEVPGPETVFDDPGKYVGQELTLSVVVDKVVDANSFRVVSEDPEDPSLLVIYSGLPVVKEQAIIKASGTITPFTPKDVNKTLGAQLPVATFDISDDEFALVASSVEVVIGAGGGGGKPTDTASTTGTTAVALAPPAPAYQPAPAPAPAYVPPDSSGSEGSTSSGSGSGSSGESGGSSEPSGGGSGSGTGSSSEPSGSAQGGPASSRGDLTFTDQSASSGQYSDSTYFEALLTDEEGEPIEGAKVTFVLDDSEYPARTDSNGLASTSPTLSLAPGNYQLKVLWERGGKPRAKDKDRFEVLQDDSVLQVAVDGNGSNATLVAQLTDGDSGSAGLYNRQVDFYADGELLGSAMTDESGVARLDVPDKYHERRNDFSATFEGDDYYLTSSANSE